MLLIIDNYDSFTYNLYHYFGELGYEAQVYRNDEIAVDQIIKLKPKGINFPGPCGPEKAGISVDLVKAVGQQKIPLLGVCLGHHNSSYAKIISAPKIMHGKVDMVFHSQKHMILRTCHRLSKPQDIILYVDPKPYLLHLQPLQSLEMRLLWLLCIMSYLYLAYNSTQNQLRQLVENKFFRTF